MTPLALEMLLWFHTHEGDGAVHPSQASEAAEEIVQGFLDEGIVGLGRGYKANEPPKFALTERGKAWLDLILSIAPPVAQWVNAEGQFPGKLHLEAGAIRAAEPAWIASQEATLPDGFTPVASVPQRGKLPPGLNHDTHVQVIYRDGRFNKAAGTGRRVEVGEASLFNWKHAGPGMTIVNINGKGESRQGVIGNPDDDIIGYRLVAPPENKMAMPKAVG
jgi:hypothetical protein